MANKPLTSEAIALTEKKMDMTLDDIIKMNKTNSSKSKKQRLPNKNQRPSNGSRDKMLKIREYMDSKSTIRQGLLAKKRTNFIENSFPSAPEAARRAVMAPFHNRAAAHNRAVNWNKQRAGSSLRHQRNQSNGVSISKRQFIQQAPQPGDTMFKQKPKTLDSLFANMKEQRMRGVPHTSNGVGGGRGGLGRNVGWGNQPRQPWLRGRFGSYRN